MATLHQQVWINAPKEKVYEALASAEGLGQWWAPHTTTETNDGLVLAHSPGPAHGDVQMKVLESTPPRRIEWEIISTHPPSSPASAWTGTHIVFEISERESPGHWLGMDNMGQPMTVLNFRHEGWNEASEFLGFCNYAWGLTLDLLRIHCEATEETT
jgi:uncharacterized protein YndB with AHSA1/START domain